MASTPSPGSSATGFWQVLAPVPDEATTSFRNTTTTERAGVGFTVYTRAHYIEIRVRSMRTPPADHPPTDHELSHMFRSIRASAGRCSWTATDDGWSVDHDPVAESHPDAVPRSRALTADGTKMVATGADGEPERWRRLSGPGSTPMSGAWQSGEPSDRWMYLGTEGHYGILHVDLTVPPSPQSFSVNVGARLETSGSFDHWPMMSQVFGYDVRKHESFALEQIEPDRFVASIPTFPFPAAEWTRLE